MGKNKVIILWLYFFVFLFNVSRILFLINSFNIVNKKTFDLNDQV